MNIYVFELRSNVKSVLLWAVSLSAVCALIMSLFPSYSQSEYIIRGMLTNIPDQILKAMGMNLDVLFDATGFYSFSLTYISLIGAVQAASLGIGIMSRENREKISDFLLTKPISRKRIVTFKLAAALTALIISNIIYLCLSTAVCFLVMSTLYIPTIIMISLTLFFIQLAFMCLGAATAVFLRIKSVISTSLILTVIFFSISLGEAFADKQTLQYFTPFHYFDQIKIAIDRAYELKSFIILFILCAICITAVFIRSIRRDIPAV